MRKVEISDARATVRTEWWNSGSIMRGDYATGLASLTTELAVESPNPPEEVAELIRVAEAGCYVLSGLADPPETELRATLNGAPIEF